MTRSLRTLLTTGTAERKAYFVIFYAYFAFGILLQVFPPLLNDVMRDFGLSRQAACRRALEPVSTAAWTIATGESTAPFSACWIAARRRSFAASGSRGMRRAATTAE